MCKSADDNVRAVLLLGLSLDVQNVKAAVSTDESVGFVLKNTFTTATKCLH